MDLLLLAVAGNITWYLLPLAIAVSLVYSASRFELPEAILRRAARLFIIIMVSMGIIFAVLQALSWNL